MMVLMDAGHLSLRTDAPGHTRLPARYLMSIMGSIGLGIIYGFKVNLSIAIVAMVNHTAVGLMNNKTLQHINVSLKHEDGPFPWDENTEGLILGSYFWGYIVSLMPGGMIAEYVSARWVLNFSVLLNVLASLLMPMAADFHYRAFICMRVIQGIGGGISFPAVHVMVAKWAPPNERSLLASIAYAGTALGNVVFIFASGIIATYLGWKSVFYVEGVASLIWCIAWAILIQDSPEEQKILISHEEREYIISSIGKTKESHMKLSEVPWFQIFKSAPFLAILVTHFCSNFGWYMILTQLPTFMTQILHYQLKDSAWLSALPFFCMWVFTLALSKLLSNMHDKNWISVTVSRKIGTLFSSAIPMFCLLAVTYVGNNRTLAVALMTVGITCIGGMYCGFLANHIDLAPNFAGTLVAITNTFATIPGIIVPLIVGNLTKGSQTIESWRVIFFMTAFLYIIEMLIYSMFGTGEEQPWNKVKSQNTKPADVYAQSPERSEYTVPLNENRHHQNHES
ncbi:hypothetical protein QAD02_016470 [Eretmocerus hayati]|uniref:Uncharacterized protein n=1 Tax=Eretmocerus hayati TaxID=131215 RepID=A0ACC2PC60_9HYME|nr:hypothetical protein QAD02_016470 [Eretmocerus hayati]